ncbi:unnamed protein product [Linum trigynum]|uniref:Uncharacterized protein n=1 Tax=Linum trigynum TaxID=586398 RepID=A0AAV2D3J4_9ROSI
MSSAAISSFIPCGRGGISATPGDITANNLLTLQRTFPTSAGVQDRGFLLQDDCHWIVVPATFISVASLFCIEEVGVLIEEPFPMLVLDELCTLVA